MTKVTLTPENATREDIEQLINLASLIAHTRVFEDDDNNIGDIVDNLEAADLIVEARLILFQKRPEL
jgi:hypothetical protein